jgi:D-sedoheptulose 7-phosphate isomerase
MKFDHVILDRDGVLNVEAPGHGYVRSASDLRWIPGALEGMVMLRRAGVRLSIATNQSGIGRGLVTTADVEAVHERLRQDVVLAGGSIDAIFYCPHAPESACSCRKPAPGMINEAIRTAGIREERTLVVGDARRDLEAAWRGGVAAALLRTGKGKATEPDVAALNVPIYDDLPALVRAMLTESAPPLEKLMNIQDVFAEHDAVVKEAARLLPPTLERIVAATDQCLRRNNKIFACGNGGSASDSQHLVAELVGRFRDERRALAAISLTADTATLTAVGNDYGFERVFARQIEGLARPGDLLFAISTSGNSANVLRAAEAARSLGCTVVAMTGAGGGKLAALADFSICAPSTVVARIQEVHTLCIHVIAESIDVLVRPAADARA